MGIIGAAADKVGLGLDLGETFSVNPIDQARDFRHHFGADPVAGQQQTRCKLS